MRRFGQLFSVFFATLGLLFPQTSLAAPTTFAWQARPMQSGEIANIVVSPSSPDILYLGVEVNSHSMYKSEDNGKNWRRIDNGDHTKDVAVHPTNPDIAFYADSQSLWRTTSGGVERLVGGSCNPNQGKCATAFDKVINNNYAAGPSRTSFSAIAIAPSDPQIVYASIRGETRGGPFNQSGSGGQLFRSTDGGATFTELKDNYPSILTLFVDPQNAEHLLIGSDTGIYHSTDSGATVSSLSKGERDISSFDSTDGQTYFAAVTNANGGVLRSTDGGANWTKISDGFPNRNVFRVRIVRDSPNIVWATTRGGVARSTDGGLTWSSATGDLPATNLKALAVDPRNPAIALVATDTHVFDVQHPQFFSRGQYYQQGLYRTEDGGKTWARSDAGLIEEKVIEITAHPTRAFEAWAGQQSSRGMYRTKDAGQTWSLSPGLLTHYPMRLAYVPGSDDHLAHTSLHTGEDFGTSTDDGVSWNILSEQTFFNSLGEAGLKLFNKSLTANSNLHLHGLAIDPTNPQTIYVGSVHDESPFNNKPLTGAHLFKSSDGGATWTESDTGFEHTAKTAIHDLEVDPTNPQNVYVATTRDEAQVGNGIWKSADSGATWQRANTGLPDNVSAEVIVVHPQDSNRLLAGTMQGLYLSSDGAVSWQKLRLEEIWDVELDPTNPELIYAGGTLGIWQSPDFGQTWTDVSTNLPEGRVRSLAVGATGQVVYAAVDGSGLYVATDPSVTVAKDDGKTTLSEGSSPGLFTDQSANRRLAEALAGQAATNPARTLAYLVGSIVLALVLLIGLIAWLNHRREQKAN